MTLMLPNTASRRCTDSEAAVFTLLKDAPGSDDYVCLHSVGLARHDRKEYAEADFVVIGPPGVFCLEVKGGEVKRQGGLWQIGWPGRSYTSHEGPFKQAQRVRWPLEREIRKRTGLDLRRTAVVGWGVVFPDIIFDAEDVEWDNEVVFDQRDKDTSFVCYILRLESYFRRRIEETGKPLPNKLGPAQVRMISDCLRGDFDVVLSMKGMIGESRRELLSLSPDQFRVLDFALHDSNPRLICDGAAGTGKTLIAREAAKRLSDRHSRVLVVCFNENLARFLKKDLAEVGKKIEVWSIYKLLGDVIRRGGFGDQMQQARVATPPDKLFLDVYPRLFDDAATNLLERAQLPQFDCVVIDEGQDILNTPVLNCLDLLVTGGFRDGRWAIFLDGEVQSDMYGRMDKDVRDYLQSLGPAVCLLKENFRNPKAIVTEMCALTKLPEPICRRTVASKVDYRVVTDQKDEAKKLRALLIELMQQGVSADQITILSAKRQTDSCLSRHPIDIGKQIVWIGELDDRTEPSDVVTASTISGFKGLENEVIILTDLPSSVELSSWERSIVYVGMTRARTLLYAIVKREFIDMRSQMWIEGKNG